MFTSMANNILRLLGRMAEKKIKVVQDFAELALEGRKELFVFDLRAASEPSAFES